MGLPDFGVSCGLAWFDLFTPLRGLWWQPEARHAVWDQCAGQYRIRTLLVSWPVHDRATSAWGPGSSGQALLLFLEAFIFLTF